MDFSVIWFEVEGEITIEYFLDHSMIEVYLIRESNDTSKLRGRRRTKNQCKLK